MKRISKTEAKEKIEEFFKNIKDKNPKEVKKIKRLAMSHNIKLGEKRKKFCKKCYSADLKTKSTKNKNKTVECQNCGNRMRWKLK
jgi:RNase P subunit RPR2